MSNKKSIHMNPAKSLVVRCPHCGGKKELLQLLSGNTFGAEQWSDAKQIAPMLPRVSPVQKCPECGRYYLMSRLSEKFQRTGDSYSFETGWLNFSEALEAISEIESLTEGELSTLGIVTVWAYNDIIREGGEPNDTQRREFVSCVTKLLENKNLFADNEILLAELNREIGNYDEAISILSDYRANDEYVDGIVQAILNKAKEKDSKVFKI